MRLLPLLALLATGTAAADVTVTVTTTAPPGVQFSGPPLMHFSPGVDALISVPEPVARDRMSAAGPTISG